MTFGFKALNDDAYVQIDTDMPRLCFLRKGTYGGSNYSVTVSFGITITTEEPPLVFIRPTVGAGSELLGQMFLNGPPGAWTGFTMRTRNVNYQPTGSWFVATFASRSEADFGMRLFDETGAVIYDSGAPAVIVTAVRADWVYRGTQNFEIGQTSTWSISRGLDAGEYMMINSFAALSFSSSNAGAWTGVSANASTTYMYHTAGATWISSVGHRPVLYARLTY